VRIALHCAIFYYYYFCYSRLTSKVRLYEVRLYFLIMDGEYERAIIASRYINLC